MQENLSKIDPSNWVSEHGQALYAYAMSRLRNEDSAEDVVQEALLGGLKSLRNSPPQSDIGPWLMGILKKKVADRQRHIARVENATGDIDPVMNKLFDKHGNWTQAARSADPLRLDSLEQAEFLGILRGCVQGLPPKQAAAFVGREVDERNPEELCQELGISSTNLWVLMHRARIRLAECIRARWILGGT